MISLLSPKKNSSPHDWEIYTLNDAYEYREHVKYVVKGLFELPSLNIVFGSPGSLKSMLVADLACCVAKGANWLAADNKVIKGGIQTTKCGVLWLDFDNGKHRTHNRFAALGRAHNLPNDEHLLYVSVPDPWLDAGTDEHIRALADLIIDKKVELVIIDNLAAISGKVDENSSAMIQILLRLRWLAENVNVCIITIHHARKSIQSGARKGDSLRGHSGIEGAIDLALFVERKGQSETVTLEPTKLRGYLSNNFTADFSHKNDEYGDLVIAKFSLGNKKEIKPEKDIDYFILSALEDKTMNQTQLIQAVRRENSRYSKREIQMAIKELIETGNLTAERGSKNALLISTT